MATIGIVLAILILSVLFFLFGMYVSNFFYEKILNIICGKNEYSRTKTRETMFKFPKEFEERMKTEGKATMRIR